MGPGAIAGYDEQDSGRPVSGDRQSNEEMVAVEVAMEVMPRRTFEASVEGRLKLWDRALYELERDLGSSTPEHRSKIHHHHIRSQ